MQKGLVTVVIPIYNVEKYLNRCIDSVVKQTYTNLEILLIDDGSPDKCPELCDEWAKKDHRIRVIHKKNAGLGMARNTGIENASGEYICFFDSDDYVAEDLIEKAQKKICAEQAEIVVYGYISANPEKNVYCKSIPIVNQDVYEGVEILNSFLPDMLGVDPRTGKDNGVQASVWVEFYCMTLIQRTGWRFVSEREIISEDYYSHLVLYKDVRKVAILKEALYYYCVNDDSLTRKYRPDRFEKIKYFYKKCLEFCEENRYPDEVYHRCMQPFVNFTIGALKQEAAFSENPQKSIRQIVDDPILQDVLRKKKKDKENWKVTILFFAIRHKWYSVVKLMLNMQNYSQKNN